MRTFEDIIPPSRRKEADTPNSGPGNSENRRRGGGFPFMTLAVVAVIVVASVAALMYLSTARVEVTPNAENAAVDGTFTATQSSGDLPYELITASKVATQSVPSTGTKTVSASASGPITIYNTQAKAQRLVATTRFQTASGLVFRIHTAVNVPAGTSAKPGSVTATAYADKPGSDYNVGPTSFTLPGLAGSSLATAVYARSSSAMTGGASGVVPTVDPATQTQTVTALTTALGPDLSNALTAKIPPGYVLVPGSATTSYAALEPAPSTTTGQVDLKVQGTATAAVFPASALARTIAGAAPGMGYQGESVTLDSVSGLSLKSAALPSASDTSFTFTLSGTANIVYVVSPDRIAAAVAGKSRSAAEVVLTSYPEVKRAVLVLRPFWKQSFPADPSSIRVTVASSTP